MPFLAEYYKRLKYIAVRNILKVSSAYFYVISDLNGMFVPSEALPDVPTESKVKRQGSKVKNPKRYRRVSSVVVRQR